LNIIDSQNLGFLMINSITSQQYITDRDGQKTGVILSIDEYERLLDDLHDLAVVAERRSETPVNLDKMKEWLKEDGVSIRFA
jgi:PHD/YefM family antitoxin component YafN of YafNO toxin-antitoxin module